MDYDKVLHSFELPKTPASTIDGHGYDSSDDVKITGVFDREKSTNIGIVNHTVNHMNLQQMIATPPQSPPYPMAVPAPGMAVGSPNGTMPLLSQLLSNPNFAVPEGYVVCVPCYLCKQPFNNVDRLKEHLAMHATIMQQTAMELAARVEKPEPRNRQLDDTNILYSCEYCGKVVNSQYKLGYHRRNQHREEEAKKKAQEAKTQVFGCQLCKKSYIRKSYLQLHMKMKHGVNAAGQKSQLSSKETTDTMTFRTPSQSPEPRRQIWSTNLLNAVAAAQYNPANESAHKYISSASEPRQQHVISQQSGHPAFEPEQKYPLRSPFFNPNLWMDAYF